MACDSIVAAADVALVAGIRGQGAATSLAALLPKVLHLRQNKTMRQSAAVEKALFHSEFHFRLIHCCATAQKFMC